MAGLRYRDMSPFISGRDQRINGVEYLRGEPIPAATVASFKHLDALISQFRLIPAKFPYADVPHRDPQPVSVPKIERMYLAAFGANALMGAGDSGEVSEPETLTVSLDTVPDGTVDEVLDWVGDVPGRAAQALEYELENKNRSTLIDALEQIIGNE